MPIYEYRCTDCGDDFERLIRSMFSVETITCPSCGSDHVKKAVSLFGTASGGSREPAQLGLILRAGWLRHPQITRPCAWNRRRGLRWRNPAQPSSLFLTALAGFIYLYIKILSQNFH